MKKKRLLATVLASALMVTAIPFQAFAGPVATSSDAKSGDISGDSTIASSAMLKVKIPTDFNFVVNPLELPVTGSNETAQIISTPYTIINKSNMDVQVTVTPEFTSTTGVAVASSPDEIKNVAGEEPIIFLQVAPMAAEPKLTGSGTSLKYDTADTAATFASGDGLSVTIGKEDTTNPVYFKMKNMKNAYSTDGVTMKYDEDIPNSTGANKADAIGFKFIGKVSQMSEWTNHAPSVTVHYEFDFITNETYTSNASVSGTYGMVDKDLAVSGPVMTLKSDSTFKLENVGDYNVGMLRYIMSDTPITESKADIAQAVIDGDTTIGGKDLKTFIAGAFTYEPETKSGYFGPNVKKLFSEKYCVVICPLRAADAEPGVFAAAAVSNSVKMDLVP